MAGRAPPAILEWDEVGVASFFKSLGLPYYEEQLREHGITGEILVHLHHDALKDIGIHSVGHRLAILKAVYAVKVEQNVPVEDEHFVPASFSGEGDEATIGANGLPGVQQILDLFQERDDRIRILELELQQLQDTVHWLRDETRSASTSSLKSQNKLKPHSPTSALFPHPLSQSVVGQGQQSNLARKESKAHRGGGGEAGAGVPDGPGSPMDSPQIPPEEMDPDLGTSGQQQGQQGQGDARRPGTSQTLGSSGGHHLGASTGPGEISLRDGGLTPTTPTMQQSLSAGASKALPHDSPAIPTSTVLSASTFASSTTTTPLLGSSTSDRAGPEAGTSSSSRTIATTPGGLSGSTSGASGSSAENPYRSFRVTLEDPCYKVLPAALKKYKINDDWRQYALFIGYANTDRCLSYDEKPLLLFQKLKESNQNPVFMLRHIKEIKSPVVLAAAKHASRREKRAANAGQGLDKPPSTSRDGSTVTPVSRATRLHHAPVLLPVGKDKANGSPATGEDDDDKPPASPRENFGYCIAIYPYLADREDEFDVSVGDTFVIVSKAKGWWVVHRDVPPGSVSDNAPRKSAWVPAGCLLETSVPPLSLGDSSTLSGPNGLNAKDVPIDPSYILSVSTPGVVLMDYAKKDADELDAKKGTTLRILKRYNHWSYAVKEETGERGWLPSWFCGKSRGVDQSPSTATSSRIPQGEHHPPSVASTPVIGGGTLHPAEGMF